MISVEKAVQIIQQNTLVLSTEHISFQQLAGRRLAESIVTDTDLPPFNRVTMDGIAVNFQAFQAIRNQSIVIENLQAAGQPQLQLHNASCCIEVMTGAILPLSCDTVIRYEDINIENNCAHILPNVLIKAGQNVQLQGIEKTKGAEVIAIGTSCHAGHVAIAASCGYEKVLVYKQPKIAVVSTGDELVEVSETPLPHQIRRSNAFAFEALLKQDGIEAQLFHFQDDLLQLEIGLNALLLNFDCILMSGGVSKGKLDFVPEILKKLGVDEQFHRIAQKPGKPMWFGAKDNVKVFAFPGNPVSGMVCYLRYFRPWLNLQLGKKQEQKWVTVTPCNLPQNGLTNFVAAQLNTQNTVDLLAGKGSGDFANLSLADGFIELEPNAIFEQNGLYRFWKL